MPFLSGHLANGQLATSAADLYTAPADTIVYVKRLSVFNTNSAEQTVLIWLQRAGDTARMWRRYVLSQNESAEVLEAGDAVHLEAGDKIRASTTTATAVDYYMTGVRET